MRATRSAQRAAILLPRLDGARERDAVDSLVGDDGLADLAAASQQRNHAAREVLEARHEHQRREGGELRRLADHAVTRREGRRDLPGE
jgi:hypothetical protein